MSTKKNPLSGAANQALRDASLAIEAAIESAPRLKLGRMVLVIPCHEVSEKEVPKLYQQLHERFDGRSGVVSLIVRQSRLREPRGRHTHQLSIDIATPRDRL